MLGRLLPSVYTVWIFIYPRLHLQDNSQHWNHYSQHFFHIICYWSIILKWNMLPCPFWEMFAEATVSWRGIATLFSINTIHNILIMFIHSNFFSKLMHSISWVLTWIRVNNVFPQIILSSSVISFNRNLFSNCAILRSSFCLMMSTSSYILKRSFQEFGKMVLYSHHDIKKHQPTGFNW